jgi:drug/metabolite transporter (DMT)-like permease
MAVLLALIGSLLLCGGFPNEWNRGDLLTLACAFMSACHFLILQKVAKATEHAFLFNILQMCWAGLLTLPFSILLEPFPDLNMDLKPILSLLYLGFGSMLIGFMLHVRAQRNLSSTVSGLICLLEAPFASLFAFALLNESMGLNAIIGASVIVGAAMIAALTPVSVLDNHLKN